MKQFRLLTLLVLLMTAATGAWAQEPVAKDIVVSPESGTNISDAIKDALGTNGDWALNITINLAKGGTYTVTESIVPSASIIINGNDATIDASALTAHFIMMRKTPSYDKVESGQYVVTTPSKIENVTITGLTKSLFYDNGRSYVFEDFTIDNCLINYSVQGNLIINLAASTVINFTIKNSTFYCKDKTTSSANCIALSGVRPWQVTGFEDSEGKLLVDHNTFYNVAYKKQFFNTNTLKGQNKYKYEFNSNIFVNVSNKKIYGNMTNNKNQLTTDGKNTYLWDGTFFSETNYNGDEGLQSDPSFKDADNGDFTVGKTTDQFANKTGDPRWNSFKVKMADGTQDADKWTVKVGEGQAQALPIGGLKGDGSETVTLQYNGRLKVKGVKATSDAAPAKAPATVTTAPQAKTDVEAGSTTALIEAGVADGGTMMYVVTTTNTMPTSTVGFSATVPTAQTCAAGTVYVWYYAKADDSHTDSDITGPVSVTVKAAALSESFTTNQAKDTYNGTHFTITCTDKGDGDGIHIGQNRPLTITAKNGETITKVEFHCTYGSGYASQTTVTAGTLNWTTNSATGSIDNVNASTVSMSNSNVDWVQINQITVYYAE